MSILRRLLPRRDRADRRGAPLVVIQINFFGFDAAAWVRGLLHRRRRIAAIEPPRRSMPSSFIGGGRSLAGRALAELDAQIPSEPRHFHGAAPVVEEAPATDPAPPVRILLGRPHRGR